MAKVLVVDDDADVMRILETRLTDAGHQVLQATDGPTGLAKAKETTPDLILLDVMMPEMDGLTVLQRLKFDPSTDKIPVVIITAKGEKMEKLFIMEGATGYLTKPFVFEELKEIVNKCLAGTQPS